LARDDHAAEPEASLPSELTNALEGDSAPFIENGLSGSLADEADGDEDMEAEPVSSEPMPAFSRESELDAEDANAGGPMPSFPLDDDEDEDESYAGAPPGGPSRFRDPALHEVPESHAGEPSPSFSLEGEDSLPEALERPSNSEPMPSFELEDDDEAAEDEFGELPGAIPPPAVLAAPSGAPRSPLPPPPLP